jgi:hypothetical protein
MGIGAGFKLKDKEKGKDKEDVERSASGQILDVLEKDKDEEDSPSEKHPIRSRVKSLRHRSSHRQSHEDPALASTLYPGEHTVSLHHSGWTAMLEDWYVNGGCHSEHNTPTPHTSSQDEHRVTASLDDSEIALSTKAKSTGDLNGRMSAHHKGPYELLVKERMMGLYLAIFIHRDTRSLVKGTVSIRSCITFH